MPRTLKELEDKLVVAQATIANREAEIASLRKALEEEISRSNQYALKADKLKETLLFIAKQM